MTAPAADDIAALLASFRFRSRLETDVQDGIAEILGAAYGDEMRREVELGKENRIDFLVGGVGLEVKTRGTLIDIVRQAQRYVARPEVTALIIAATRAQLLVDLPRTLGGKPLVTIHLRSFP